MEEIPDKERTNEGAARLLAAAVVYLAQEAMISENTKNMQIDDEFDARTYALGGNKSRMHIPGANIAKSLALSALFEWIPNAAFGDAGWSQWVLIAGAMIKGTIETPITRLDDRAWCVSVHCFELKKKHVPITIPNLLSDGRCQCYGSIEKTRCGCFQSDGDLCKMTRPQIEAILEQFVDMQLLQKSGSGQYKVKRI